MEKEKTLRGKWFRVHWPRIRFFISIHAVLSSTSLNYEIFRLIKQSKKGKKFAQLNLRVKSSVYHTVREACRIEHDISEQSFQKLKKWKELGHSEEANGD